MKWINFLALSALVLGGFLAMAVPCQSQNEAGFSTDLKDPELMLNNGEKWEIEAEMMGHIKEGKKRLNEYLNSSEEDYLKLARSLSESNSNLIFSCSMTGPAHDMLHKWLHPHLRLVNQLKRAEGAEEAEKLIAALSESYRILGAYFQ
ncbi:MAG: hypothetical protein EA411_11285 [Saprospirales bacterium]|nr:MAG: hypothetical protein EA411_11285 [Saprospirales bacterium]